MTSTSRCDKCDKDLAIQYKDIKDADIMWVSLNFKKFLSLCNECHHLKDYNYVRNFCSAQCLKDWIDNNLDGYIKKLD